MRRPRDKIASSAGLSPTKVAASPTLQKNLGEVGCINWWKGHSSRWKRIIVFFKILDYISNSVALKLVSLAKNSMSLFCLPITSPNLIYHLLARLQGFLFFFFAVNAPWVFLTHLIPVFHLILAPSISDRIYKDRTSFYQFLLLLQTFQGLSCNFPYRASAQSPCPF